MTQHGQFVTVKGEQYRVVGVGPASAEPKFWGKRKFTLRKLGTSEIWYTYGKRVAHNSRLIFKNSEV